MTISAPGRHLAEMRVTGLEVPEYLATRCRHRIELTGAAISAIAVARPAGQALPVACGPAGSTAGRAGRR